MIICKKDNPSPCPLISSVILEKSPERPVPSNKLPSPLPQHASPTTHHPPLTDTTRRRAMIDWRFSGAALLFPQPDENCGIADAGTPHLLRTPLRVTSACSAACRPGRPHYHIHNASGDRFLNATPVPLFASFFFAARTCPTCGSCIAFERHMLGALWRRRTVQMVDLSPCKKG